MATTDLEKIVDGDGHIFEDVEAIARLLPPIYDDLPNIRRRGVFPPLDHMHSQPSVTPPGSFIDPGPEGWMDFMGDVGIDSTVLYPTAGLACGRMIDLDWAVAVTRAYNDWLHQTYLARSPRLQGVALIPMQEPEMAVLELRRAVEELGMRGAMLPATGLKAHLGSREYWPVYAEADRLGCALAVHGGCHGGLGFDDLNNFAAIHAMGHPFGITIAFGSMLINGIFDRFPNVRFGFLEGGVGWFLMALERFDGSYKGFNPYDPGKRLLNLENGETVAEYILRQVRQGRIFVGVEGDEPSLPHAVKLFGNQPFVYSSDFPHEVNKATCKAEIQELLESDELTAQDKAAILHGNAERLYGLKR